jgi:alcohol oxidase
LEVPPRKTTAQHVGGASGCVIAGRLAKADPSLQILIIESGIDNRELIDVVVPGYMANHFGRVKDTVNVYLGNPNSGDGPEFSAAVCGSMLGGGSSVNYMMYTRGCSSDYDDWKTQGWTFEDLKPFFKKVIYQNYIVHWTDGVV